MRVLFLDVDGVLNHEDCFRKHASGLLESGAHTLDPDCLRRVREISDKTGARIVVSSVWRGSQESMAPLLEAFGERVIGVTPFIKITPRSDEIGAWIVQHSAIPLECVAVDDEQDAAGSAWKFVQTSFTDGGLTELKAAEITEAFGAALHGGQE